LSAKRKNLVLHVRAAVPGPAPAASVTGNRAALEALGDLVDAALAGEAGEDDTPDPGTAA